MSSMTHAAITPRRTERRETPNRAALRLMPSPSLGHVLGEAERKLRFSYALREALRERKVSQRGIASRLGVDQRRVAAWVAGQKIPDYYEMLELVAILGVRESLFRDPPPVPEPPAYPLADYLLGAVDAGGEQGLEDQGPDELGPHEPDGPPPERPLQGGTGSLR